MGGDSLAEDIDREWEVGLTPRAELKRGPLLVEAEDGLLIVEDVRGLNLSGTQLEVLSAYETGLGEVHALSRGRGPS